MHFQDMFKLHPATFSFEFFPPRDEAGSEDLYRSINELIPLRPTFISVTYGAGGSTSDLTNRLVLRIKDEGKLDPMPHLTAVCHDEARIRSMLEGYAERGISNVLALRGDPPREMPEYDREGDAFKFAAELVGFIKRFNNERRHSDKRGFGIAVAGFPEGHPATPNRLIEMDYLKAKVDAGADCIITQMFFDNRDFYDFRHRCELSGIGVPIIAGLMPILSESGMRRMAELAAGARFPAALLRAIRRASGKADAVRRMGVHWATEQARDLLDNGVSGIHFYTLNKSTATREIYRTLGASDSTEMVV
ncbi:MAG: methylenetetrahydrofolate reductase [NAD(P)H] [Phycisphaeraceae bacterium]|nr:MAG: methylenetetrahydrofolate reductase [NAD(P)H] [Phycisphaeraceae bacterium]